MNPIQIIGENTSRSEHWRDGSFVDVLHESYLWDTQEYWKLEWSLFAICAEGNDSFPDADVFRIFSFVMLLFSCHFDPRDGFEISNLTPDELHDFRERFQLSFEGYFRRSMPSPSIFELKNPLLDS